MGADDDFDEFDDDGFFDADVLRVVDAIESRPPPLPPPQSLLQKQQPFASAFVRASTLTGAPSFARPPAGRLGVPQQQRLPVSGGGGNKPLSAVIAAASKAVPLFDDLPDDAFDSTPEASPVAAGIRRHHTTDAAPQPRSHGQGQGQGQGLGLARSSSGALRQTTLFGATISDEPLRPSQRTSNGSATTGTARPFRADMPPQPKTKHELDWDAMATWVYPTNVGSIRDYQFSIVKSSLFNNTLVALPTGLGKTFIAATVMLNFYRWTKAGKVVFVAPTKPLVSQQVDACFNTVGIPRSDTTHLNGDVSPGVRAEEWRNKRVFFMTPQTLQNDLSHGVVEPKSIALLVIDEAHRATGEYAYSQVVRYMRRFTNDFRVLALTATPGSTVEAVQTILDNLGISHVEIRTENSIDIQQYVHARDIDQVVLDHSDEILRVRDMLTAALKPLTDKLAGQNMYYARDPMNFTNYGLMMAQKEWTNGPGKTANQGLKNMMRAVFGTLTSVAHPIKLLNYHGLRPFYETAKELRAETEKQGEKGSKYKRSLFRSNEFTNMMDTVASWLAADVVGHPKLAHMSDTILNHFMDHRRGEDGDGGASEQTKVIVFSEYRDSAEEIVRTLNMHRPMVRATVFVGQADSKRSEGMKQSHQLRTIQEFKDGVHNVLVATSIGEEGLDIGQVDLIICYDSSSSPIRMLQRMGRTGRKRAGKVVVLLMRGKEENSFNRSKETYEHMQGLICEGSRFNFRTDLSTRMVPNDVHPEVDKRHVEIPVENTVLGSELPVPKRGRAAPKRPPKKFHMPEDVETGFQSVAAMLGLESGQKTAEAKTAKTTKAKSKTTTAAKTTTAKAATKGKKNKAPPDETDDIVQLPPLEAVLMSTSQEQLFRSQYTRLPEDAIEEEVPEPDLTAFPLEQRVLQSVGDVPHGRRTKLCIAMLQKLARMQDDPASFPAPYGGGVDMSRWRELPVPDFVFMTAGDGENGVVEVEAGASSRKRARGEAAVLDGSGGEEEAEAEERPAPPKRARVTKAKATAATSASSSAAAATSSTPASNTVPQPRTTAPQKRTPAAKKPPTRSKKPPSAAASNPFILGAASIDMDAPPSSSPGWAARERGIGVNSDEVGDDCARDSDDALMSDGSDNGSDLVGFLVSDDRELSVVEEEDEFDDDDDDDDDEGLDATPRQRPRPPPSRRKKKGGGGLFVGESSSRADGHDDEDEDGGLPPLNMLFTSSPLAVRPQVLSSDAATPPVVVRNPARRRVVAALDDSDDE